MSNATATSSAVIVWDDGSTLVFTFTGPAGTVTTGFNPATNPDWLETVKVSARPPNPAINIAYEDAIFTPFTTATGLNFNLQQLFSVSP